MLLIEELGLTIGGFAIAVLALWGVRTRSLSRLARTSMVAGAFGLFLCAKFAPHAVALVDQVMLFGFAMIMGNVAFEGWREASGATKLAP